ncbi:sulfite exporter TauE/SafE family protein [Clostridium aminobutyricum]|uniref:Sulfite exporter TauE/SafE family protein n=1 Tax=Clostridium aminobutyricum TaxID=33953 RepID=A0A939IG49_CLOAM|nr:sulfite exporter TauE/SafE family protein [Clostridium aminobutyricum]MBN7772585.1 sulfite exporter TauE/SafE family protein [Clostridium aminobutyricum]
MSKNLIKRILKVDGLTCTACESKIENKLIKMEGIQGVEASYARETVIVIYNPQKIQLENIIKIIEKLGYDVKRSANQVSRNTEAGSDNQLIVMGIIIFGIYLIIKNTIGFNFIPEVSQNMGYGILFVVGLLSSIHCVAMCGGINLSVCVSHQFDQADNSNFAKVLPSLLYNTGRVVSYTIIGGLVGALGSVFTLSNMGSAFITIVAGTFMVIMGLNMLNIFPALRKLNPHMPKVFANKIYSAKTNKGPFVVGLLNGLMPCGPLQAMQLYALGTGSFIAGATSMFLFSLGTVPLLFVFGALGSMLSSKFTKNLMKCSAILVIALGFAMLSRGMAFTGVTFPSFAASTNNAGVNVSTIVGEEQEITTSLDGGRYSPIAVQEGVPVKWTIYAEAEDLNGCNRTMTIPEYNIQKQLEVGENVITFTPTKTGTFGYSCWMGMIRSSITVVDDIRNIDANKVAEDSAGITNNAGSCCSP